MDNQTKPTGKVLEFRFGMGEPFNLEPAHDIDNSTGGINWAWRAERFQGCRKPRFHPSFIGIEVAGYFRIARGTKDQLVFDLDHCRIVGEFPTRNLEHKLDDAGWTVGPLFPLEIRQEASRFRQIEMKRLADQLVARSEIVGERAQRDFCNGRHTAKGNGIRTAIADNPERRLQNVQLTVVTRGMSVDLTLE